MTVHPRPIQYRRRWRDRLLYLSRRKAAVMLTIWILAFLLHNGAYALVSDAAAPRGEEPVFFLLAVVVMPTWFVAAAVYTVVRWRLLR